MLRLIFDTRVANLQFTEPPATALPTAAAFAAMQVEADTGLNLVHGDIANAFYNIEIPEELSWKFYCAFLFLWELLSIGSMCQCRWRQKIGA